MLELRNISKFFPSNNVTAIERANLIFRPGEIHALLGENGSGKSTLMHILAGYFHPSSGSIFVDGKEQRFSSTADALALGIGMVGQHPGFVKGFKVWEDCVLGAEKRGSFFMNPEALRNRIRKLSENWKFNLPIDAQTESLTISERQIAAVLSLLQRNVKWFIFDEPTAVLGSDESEKLFELFRRLRSEGCGVIFITHKVEEVLSVSDRVTVLHHGITRESQSIEDARRELINNTSCKNAEAQKRKDICSNNTPILEVKNLRIELPAKPVIHGVNLRLMPGKILGISGLKDSGLEILELAISGLLDFSERSVQLAGTIILNGCDITGKGVRAFRDSGGAYLGADRLESNLAPELPLSESLIIHAFRKNRRGIFLDTGALTSWCLKIISKAGIARSVSERAESFSGGMIQRILLAREFAEEPLLLLLANAGSSLDQANFLKLSQELRALANQGSSVLLLSADAEELSFMADEVLVLKNGSLTTNPMFTSRLGASNEV